MATLVSTSGKYLASQLTLIDPDLIRFKTAPAWTVEGLKHQTRGDLPPGALKITASTLSLFGEAGIADVPTIDIPMVDYGQSMADFGALRIAVGAAWEEDEIDQYRLASLNGGMLLTEDPIQTKMEALKVAIEQKAHRLILFGSKARNFRGWFNNDSITIAPVVTAEKPLIMSNEQLYDWISKIITEYTISNALTPDQVVMYIDPRLSRKMNALLQNGSTVNVASQLVSKENADGILSEIKTVYELTPEIIQAYTLGRPGAVAAGSGRIILGSYRDASSAVRRYNPFQRTEPEHLPGTYRWVVLGSYSTSELMHRQPMNFTFLDYNTALV